MAGYRTVRQGECFSSIAKKYGFCDYRTIYLHPNNADLKSKRPNPDIICPGDVIFIPDKEQRGVPCATGKSHVFRASGAKVFLRLYMHDADDTPYAAKRYRLIVEGHTVEGKTTETGLLEHQIPADAENGELIIWLENDDDSQDTVEVFPLRIGFLDPSEEITGIQARLNNLGFDCGAVDGVLGPKTRAAIARFQSKFGLDDETGQISEATRTKLREIHESGHRNT